MLKNKASAADERTMLTQRIASARYNLLAVVLFTLINIVMVVTGGSSYFLFSAILPYGLAMEGAMFTGKMSDEFYTEIEWPDTLQFYDDSYFYIMLAVAAVILALYVIFFFLSKKKAGAFLIAATVLFAIDTLYMVFVYGVSTDSIMDIAFHAWVFYYLISGIVSASKLKKLPPENGTVEVPYAPAADGDTGFYVPDADPAPEEDNKEN